MKQSLLFLFLFISLQNIYAIPVITSFSPTSGPIGTSVIITGTGFSATPTSNTVFFGATKANVTAASTSQLTVTVPIGATYQLITVMVSNLIAFSSSPFIVTFCSNNIIDNSSFATNIDFTSGYNPWSIAIGDIDLDGKSDLVVVNGLVSNLPTISVFRNTSSLGTISLAPKVDFTTGSSVLNVVLGDIDLDGILDLSVVNDGANTVSVFRNTSTIGTISFAPKVDFATNNAPRSLTVGDIDLDGKSDLIICNYGDNLISVFRNTSTSGNISFAARVDFTTSQAPRSVAVGDIDLDGKQDIAVANQGSNTVSVFRNTSTIGIISFASKVDFITGLTPVKVVIGDIDLDGKPDLAVANNFPSNSVSVLRNTSTIGTISYDPKVDFTCGNNTCSVAIFDIDGNGKPDLAVANNSSSFAISVFRNISISGNISFEPKVDFATGFSNFSTVDLAIGDIDLDGKPDLESVNFNSAILSILRNQIPEPSISVNSQTICFGGSTILTATGANSYSWIPSTGLNSTTGSSVTATPSITTTYTVTGTNSAQGCVSNATSIVTVNALPIVDAGNNISLCNQPIPDTLSGYSPSGGTWSGSNVSSSGVFTPNGVGSFVLTYSYTNSNNCSNQDNMTVSVINPSIANAGTGFGICNNASTVNLNSLNPIPLGGTWSGNGVTGNIFSPASLNGLQIITYTIGAGTCLSTDTIHVMVNPLPTVSVNSQTICFGGSTILTATGANSYSWNPSIGLSASTGSIVTATPIITTSYTVVGISINGCSSDAVSIVTVNPLPVVNAGNPISVCSQPIATTLTGYTPSGGTWTGSGVTAGGIFTPTAVGVFTLTYTFTNANGCINSDTIQVTVINPTPAVAGTGFSICANASSINLNSLNPTPSGGTWSGNGVTGNIFSPTSLNGIQVLTYTFGAGPCLTSDTIHVSVKPIPTVTVNSPAICIGSSSTLTANGATTYSWTPSTGLSATSGSIVTANPTVTSTYIVTGINSATGCGNSATSIVTVYPLPVVTAGSDQNFCNASTLIPLIGTPAGGIWSGVGVIGNNFNPGVAGAGNWTLTYTYTNSNICSNSDQVLMTVINPTQANAGIGFNICIDADSINLNLLNPTPTGGTWSGNGVTVNLFSPITLNGLQIVTYSFGSGLCLTIDTIHLTVNSLPILTVNFSSSICIGDSVTLTAGGATTYIWNPSTGLNNTTGATVNASPSDTTTYSVIGTTIYGCTSENFSLVTVIDLNNPLSATNANVCQSGEATISAIPSTNGNTILWYTDSIGGTSIFEGLSYTSFFGTSIIFYASTFNYLTGCESQERLPVLVSVYPLPQIEINFTDATYGNNGAINATVTNGHPPYTYDWSNDGTGDFDDSSFISGLTEGNYSLTVSDQQGCTNNIDVAIANGEELFVPTGFSPNSDGINDTWEIPGSFQYDDIVVSIFNLQGQLIFYQKKKYLPWDGKYQGELVPTGDYYFVIESLRHKRKQTGTLTVKY